MTDNYKPLPNSLSVRNEHSLIRPRSSLVTRGLQEVEQLRKAPTGEITASEPAPRIVTPEGITLVLIPAGTFLAGGLNLSLDGRPFEAYLPAYYLAMYPVTNAQYKKFIDATGWEPPGPRGDRREHIASCYADTKPACLFETVWQGNTFPDEKADHPVVHVDDWDIYEYCKWARVRLPAELEWEKGFRGTDGRQYPWGNAWESVRCHHAWSPGGKTTADVREYPEGRSPWGLYQMSGNVWELCKQGIDPYAGYCCAPYPDCRHAPQTARGGSWADEVVAMRCDYRVCSSDYYGSAVLGFRVAADLTA